MMMKDRKEKVEKETKLWAYEKSVLEQEQALKEDKKNFKRKGKTKKMTTSKKLITFLFINCVAIEIFACYAVMKSIEISQLMGMTTDFSPINSLIGAVIAETIGYAVYCLKSAKENTVNGITYDLAMKKYEEENRQEPMQEPAEVSGDGKESLG
jgi:hypothetical protein